MGWSTREVAEIASTTVNTVRHYHQIGLLEQPRRAMNGYKSYEVRHLVTLLRIRRLRELGVPLDQVDHVSAGDDGARSTLSAIDAELALTIERLEQAQRQIRAIVVGDTRTDLPLGFEGIEARLTATERSLLLIYAQVYDDEALRDFRDMLEHEPEDVRHDFDALRADAGERTRRDLAVRYAVAIEHDLTTYPWLRDPLAHHRRNPRMTWRAVAEAVAALYNPAQLDVLGRAHALALASLGEGDTREA
ncbi:MerR family transcriptional regulator [Microbacterium sp. NPDC089695]|uniref:MerR family transcriptional regulator n=1 Tax=Microbacterium sp. NPDC089695 TaxID=3364198 RepID=UPI00380FFF61